MGEITARDDAALIERADGTTEPVRVTVIQADGETWVEFRDGTSLSTDDTIKFVLPYRNE